MARASGLVRRLLEKIGRREAGRHQGGAPASRPLLNTRFVALDLETTGLNHRRDAIVQIAMVDIEGLALAAEPLLHTLVNPQRPIPASATRIHGIGDAHVRGAPTVDRLLPRIRDAWHDAVIVGHHVRFDLAILAAAARRHGLRLTHPPFLDTWALAAAMDARFAHLDLAEIAGRFGIDAAGFRRHDALADARLAAHLFLRLADRLIAAGCATVGQAAAMAERCRAYR